MRSVSTMTLPAVEPDPSDPAGATPDFLIRPAAGDEMGVVAELFRAYAGALGVDLSFQGFQRECATLPGAYAAPAGALLIAVSASGDAIGCVGVRPLTFPVACEMKRLHTTPAARGAGVGRALAEAAIEAATRAGYASICLDTLPTMAAAHRLYLRLGFDVTPPYYCSPVAGTIFMRKMLGSEGRQPGTVRRGRTT